MVGGVLSVTVKLAVQVDSLFAASVRCNVSLNTTQPSTAPAVAGWITCTGAEPWESVRTITEVTTDRTTVPSARVRPSRAAYARSLHDAIPILVVKSGTGAWQTPSAKALWLEAQVLMVGGVLSVTVKLAVQVDSLFAA